MATISSLVSFLLLASGLHLACGLIDDITQLDKFALKSRIRHIYGTMIHQTDVEEYYSRSQKRARINYVDYKTADYEGGLQKRRSGSYIYDETRGLVLKFGLFKCESTNLEDYYKMIRFDFLATIGHDETEGINLLDGPARIAHVIMKNKDKLVKAPGDKLVVRNTELVRYTLKLNADVFLNLYYDPQETPDQQSSISVPRIAQITVSTDMIVIDYGHFRVLDEEARKTVAGMHYDTDTIIDVFSVPIELGCSRLMQASELDIFKDKLNSRVSFQANIRHFNIAQNNLVSKMFVAYDGNLKSLRVDMTESNTDLEITQQVYNFKLNRAYDILRRSDDIYSVADEVLDISGKDTRLKQQCVATQLNKLSVAADWKQNSFSELITGSKSFVYMGKGVLRGIPVRIYEAVKTQPPFWLEQPVLYYDERNQIHERLAQPTQMGDGFSFMLSTVMYLAESDNRLLQLTIHETEGFIKTMSVRRLDIHNFVWDLSTSSIDSERPVDLFSLSDSCTSETDGSGEGSHYEMLLEDDGHYLQTSTEVLTNTHLRNLAFLEALQDVFLMPIVMISDVQTFLAHSATDTSAASPVEKNQQKQTNNFAIVASFKFSEHTTDQVVLKRLGKGEPKTIKPIKVHSFQACAMLAAHHKSLIAFGYNQYERNCYIGKPRDNEELEDLEFTMREDGPIFNYHSTEVYVLKHQADSMMKYLAMQGAYENTRLSIVKQTKKFFMRTSKDEASVLAFNINRIHVRRSRQNVNLNEMDASKATFGNIGLIEGFGFTDNSQLTKLVEPKSVKDNDNQSGLMSFDTCRASCLRDLDCKSFSVCIRGSNVECILSSLVLRSQDTIKQLDWTVPLGKVISLNLSNTSVEVRRHPNCVIHNQNSLVFFQDPSIFRAQLESLMYTRPVNVTGVEDCAAQCTRFNLLAIKHQQESAPKDEDGKAVLRTVKETPNICSSFEYIDAESLINLDEESRRVTLKKLDVDPNEPEQSQTRGFCFWTSELVNSSKIDNVPMGDTDVGTSLKIEVDIERYRLNPLMFYKRMDNIRLYQSYAPPEVNEMISRISENSAEALADINPAAVESLRYYIDNVENNQLVFGATGEIPCAMACFSQTSGLWPGCKSFDIVLEVSEDKPSKLVCLLNSITLADARRKNRNDLIGKLAPNNKTVVWHFEPKLDLAIDEIEKVNALEAYIRRASASIGYSILVIVAIATGLVSSLVLYERMFKKVIIRRISTSSNMNIVLDMNLDEQH